MKLIKFDVLSVLLVCYACCYFCEGVEVLSLQFKTGYVDIKAKNNKVLLNIVKNDGTNTENYLYTENAESEAAGAINIVADCDRNDPVTCIQTGGKTHTRIKINADSEIIKIERMIDDPDGKITDCYKLSEGTEWFGGPQLRHQHWPIQNAYFEEEPYVPTHPQNQAIAERYWLSSNGMYIFVDQKDPLFIDQNNYKDKYLCLVAKNKAPYKTRKKLTLSYEIGVYSQPREAHEHVIKRHFDKPTGHPNERMVTHPIWSTWAKYKVNVNDQVVREFADEISKNGFKNSQLEIDDNWETCYGSAKFDETKFPDVQGLVTHLKEKNFRVTLWIHPFINEDCNDGEAYDYAKENGYFVKNMNGEVHMTWWQGTNGAAAIDFTNPKAVDWWVGRLKKLQELGIDSFKFDAGEVSWLPQIPELSGPENLEPGSYTLNYTTNIAKNFGDSIEVRVGWRSQSLPIFVRMIDKDTRWTWNNGLPTLITTLLQMNLNGYMFVLPDMIGGNGYVDDSFKSSMAPSKNLFIRWLQANVFMPSLQYSFVPWDFDNETIEISRNYTNLHAEISPKIIELMKKSVDTGAPINTPIWWIDPSNIQAHKVNDEYLLGDNILVAPVLEENAITRDIYLPSGRWTDANTGKVYSGPKWFYDYSAPLNILPYFYKE